MARKNIELGVIPSGQGGDTFRSAMIKVNDMTAELYTAIEEGGGGKVQTVAGVDPDAAGDIPKAPLATALGVDGKADKTATEAALDLKADKAAVNTALSEKADKTVLDNKVDKVAGKGLSTNDFTTAEKTKLGSALLTGDYGLGSKSLAVTPDDVTGFGGYAGTTPGFPAGRNGQVITMSGAASRRTRIMTDHDADILTFQRYTDSWQTPRRVMLASDYGLGSDPRGGRPTDGVGYISDINVLRPSGKYIITPETVGGPGFYGTLEMSWYDPTGWTMLARPLTGGAMATRASINGSMGAWEWYYPTKRYQSDGLTYTNGQLQAVQHGLGAIPTSMQLFVVPIVDQASWSAGIYVLPASGYSIGANTLHVFIKVATSGFTVLDAQTGASANLTPANWRIVIRAAV